MLKKKQQHIAKKDHGIGACHFIRTFSTLPGPTAIYEGHLESKERFALKKCLLIIGKKKNMQVLSHTFTYFST